MKKNRHGGEWRDGRIEYDFSVNINPLGMPEAAKDALRSGWNIFEEYPDDGCEALREALSSRFGVDKEQIVCGNGASDLIYRLCACGGFRRVLLPVPSFTEYQRALEAAGCKTIIFPAEEKNGFVPGEEILPAITSNLDALFLCNPGNPAGGLISKKRIEQIADRCREMSVTLVIDECFLDFVKDGASHSAVELLRWKSVRDRGNEAFACADWKREEGKSCIGGRTGGSDIVVLKAFTKIFAMAGLRLGFGIFENRQLAERVFCHGAPWQVSGPAQAAGLAVLNSEWKTFIKKTAIYIAEERYKMESELRTMEFHVVPGCANYILFRGPAGLDFRLVEEGFSIRNCSDYIGMTCGENQRYYRVAVGRSEDNRLLMNAVRRCAKWR